MPKIIPPIVPKPPVSTTPPITAAAIASNSFKLPLAVSAVLTSKTWHAANIVAQNAVFINNAILTLFVGTPLAFAALRFPPVE